MITDNKMLSLESVTKDILIIPNQDGGYVRECTKPFLIGDCLVTTLQGDFVHMFHANAVSPGG